VSRPIASKLNYP